MSEISLPTGTDHLQRLAQVGVLFPVSTFVNNARNQGEKCIEPVEVT